MSLKYEPSIALAVHSLIVQPLGRASPYSSNPKPKPKPEVDCFRVHGSGFRVQGSGFRVQDCGLGYGEKPVKWAKANDAKAPRAIALAVHSLIVQPLQGSGCRAVG